MLSGLYPNPNEVRFHIWHYIQSFIIAIGNRKLVHVSNGTGWAVRLRQCEPR
jgi:hypothetical protein